MIGIRDLTVRYRGSNPALAAVTLAVKPGEMVGLLGPNGSGKTTLLRAIAGSVRPETGDIHIRNENLRALSHKERARCMAFVPQRPDNVPAFTALDLTLMGRYPHRKFLEDYTAEDLAIARRSLGDTDAAHLADRPVGTLSGGELQRVYVARAFAQEAPILLLDEAATGLDPAHATALFGRVRQRNRRDGATVLTAIHDLNLAALYCDRLVFLKNGRVAADGPIHDIFTAETLERVYNAPFLVLEHPVTGLPQALALPETERAHA